MTNTIVTPQMGGWWAMCCIQDLYRINTAEELASASEYLNDGESGARYWPTLNEALADLDEGGSMTDFEKGMLLAMRRHCLPPGEPSEKS